MIVSVNEVTLQDNVVGIFESAAQTQQYLSVEETFATDVFYFRDYKYDYGLKITLSENKRVESRQAYTVLDLLGDFGGFNDAIYFLVSLPMGYYSQAMYERQVAGELHNVKRKKKRDRTRNVRLSIADRLGHESVALPLGLGQSDVALV